VTGRYTQDTYRHVRHPMYLALLFYSLGQVLLLPNCVAGTSYLVALVLLCALRVGPEERMMLEEFGKEYEACTWRRTKRLVPGAVLLGDSGTRAIVSERPVVSRYRSFGGGERFAAIAGRGVPCGPCRGISLGKALTTEDRRHGGLVSPARGRGVERESPARHSRAGHQVRGLINRTK
jgi:hypothetical protein